MRQDQKPHIEDPRVLGANCDACPFKGRTAVPPKVVANPRLVIVAESPGKNEEITGEPLVGASGYLVRRNLKRLGVDSDKEVYKTNATLCSPDGKVDPKTWKTAVKCCRPRLERELASVPDAPILAIGGKALQTLTGKAKITPWRGAPVEGIKPFVGRHIVPTVHPAFIMRGKDAWEPVFRIDLERALNPTPFSWPPFYIDEGPEMEAGLRQILAAGKITAVDVETDNIDPFTAKLRCIGLANEDIGVSVPWEPAQEPYKSLVTQILENPKIEKTFHNAQYDLISLRHVGGFTVRGPVFDTLLAHAIVAPQLPHDLGFVVSCELNAPRWKSIFRVEGADKGVKRFSTADAKELREYNVKDCLGPVLAVPALRRRLKKLHRGEELCQNLHLLSDLAMRMRERGIKVDRGSFDEHRKNLTAAMERERAGFESLNLPAVLGANGMDRSLKKLFFNTFGIKPRTYSEKTGEPELNAEMLKQLSGHNDLTVRTAATKVLNFRQYGKLLATYIDGIPLDANDTIHPCWAPHRAVTGRWGCGDPNCQNIPAKMRNILVARPGMKLVAADFKQLEFRLFGLLTGDEALLNAFRNNIEIHLHRARKIFDDPTINKERDEYKLTKNLTYGLLYGAGADTLWRNLLPKFPNTPFRMVTRFLEAFYAEHPACKEWQVEQIRKAEENSFVEDPLSGRREYFHLGRIEPSKVLNFPIQAAAGTLLNRAALAIDKELRWNEGEGLLLAVHDELVVEGPDEGRLVNLLSAAMTQTVTLNGHTLEFTCDIESGDNWLEMDTPKAIAA